MKINEDPTKAGSNFKIILDFIHSVEVLRPRRLCPKYISIHVIRKIPNLILKGKTLIYYPKYLKKFIYKHNKYDYGKN